VEENNVITLRQPGDIADPLTEVLRNGARALLARAVEAEVAEAPRGPYSSCHGGWPPAPGASWA